MNKVIITFVLFSAVISTVAAQVPEFGLKVNFYRNNQTVPNKTIAFGYDANAADSLEGAKSWFPDLGGEQLAPPPGFDWDFRLSGTYINRFADLGDGSYVDIRKKPSASNFILKYEIDMTENDFTTAKIDWDNTSIPSIVKHITLSSSQNSNNPVLDMKNVSSFVFPTRDSIQLYGNMILKLYYNQDLSVSNKLPNSAIDQIAIYPNPMESHSTLSFRQDENRNMMISIYDVTGRELKAFNLNAIVGDNEFTLDKNSLSLRSGVYMVRLSSIDAKSPVAKSIMLIVQ